MMLPISTAKWMLFYTAISGAGIEPRTMVFDNQRLCEEARSSVDRQTLGIYPAHCEPANKGDGNE